MRYLYSCWEPTHLFKSAQKNRSLALFLPCDDIADHGNIKEGDNEFVGKQNQRFPDDVFGR